MELESEEKREGGVICAETFEEDWSQCRICEEWAHKNCAEIEGNNLFYEYDVYFTKKMQIQNAFAVDGYWAFWSFGGTTPSPSRLPPPRLPTEFR
ncbi:hypothetical protein AVEN_249496-1 [Araneus ventricosus]|uniref:Uncharacterized protein n=1 Tax=Araneus ventricosus TaxID=182803 RepID=A0A4Y2NJG9_ARAVE|nr:hypothetical protein AVEN_249496-1 [Araneus ventricosus]